MTLDKWLGGFLTALDLMNGTNSRQNEVLMLLLAQLAEMDLTLQALVQEFGAQ